jgi:hypothetical protein
MKQKAASFIQRYLKGYQARRKTLYLIMNHKADLLHEDFWRIDLIQKNHFQRLIRRAWKQYLWNKAEKLRKKKEKAKKNKGKKKKKKKKAAPKPDAVTDDADGVANIKVGMGDDEGGAEEEKDEEMEGDMEMEDKGEGEDEGAAEPLEGDENESPGKTSREGEHDENLD